MLTVILETVFELVKLHFIFATTRLLFSHPTAGTFFVICGSETYTRIFSHAIMQLDTESRGKHQVEKSDQRKKYFFHGTKVTGKILIYKGKNAVS